MSDDDRASGDGRPRRGHDLPDPRPLRRIQAATAVLIGVAAVVTLLSDERPGAVRWGTVVGLALLIVAIWAITRRRRRDG